MTFASRPCGAQSGRTFGGQSGTDLFVLVAPILTVATTTKPLQPAQRAPPTETTCSDSISGQVPLVPKLAHASSASSDAWPQWVQTNFVPLRYCRPSSALERSLISLLVGFQVTGSGLVQSVLTAWLHDRVEYIRLQLVLCKSRRKFIPVNAIDDRQLGTSRRGALSRQPALCCHHLKCSAKAAFIRHFMWSAFATNPSLGDRVGDDKRAFVCQRNVVNCPTVAAENRHWANPFELPHSRAVAGCGFFLHSTAIDEDDDSANQSDRIHESCNHFKDAERFCL